MGTNAEIGTTYPPELLRRFTGLPEQLDAYHAFVDDLKHAQGSATVNLETPPHIVQSCAWELQQIARVVRTGIQRRTLYTNDLLYRMATGPARQAGELTALPPESPVGTISGTHRYFVLERQRNTEKSANDLLVLLQRIPFGQDTQPEVHGITPDHKPANNGGIEVYLPLSDGIEFYINGAHIRPKALETLITVLPGDVHHHIKTIGSGPARVLIFGGFGFSRGVKTDDTNFMVLNFAMTSRFIPVTQNGYGKHH